MTENALGNVRTAARRLRTAEGRAESARRTRDAAIVAATQAPKDGRASYTNEQVAEAAGISEPRVRMIRRGS